GPRRYFLRSDRGDRALVPATGGRQRRRFAARRVAPREQPKARRRRARDRREPRAHKLEVAVTFHVRGVSPLAFGVSSTCSSVTANRDNDRPTNGTTLPAPLPVLDGESAGSAVSTYDA